MTNQLFKENVKFLLQKMKDKFPLPEQSDVTSIFNEPQLHTQIFAMLKEIHFSDPPIIFLFIFLSIWIILLFYFRRNMFVSTILFALTCFFIGITQYIDDFIHQFWTQLHFSSNYLGSSTYVFMFTFWAAPLLSASIIYLCILLFDVLKLYWNSSIANSIKSFFTRKTKKE